MVTFAGMQPLRGSAIRTLGSIALFQVLAFAVFAPVLSLSLLSDDHTMVWRNGPASTAWEHGFFRPVSFLSFRLVHVLFGDSGLAHRCFSVAVHGLNTFLMFGLFKCMVPVGSGPRSRVGAWMAALLFLVYPFHQEAVVWIVGRYPAMATSFILLSLIALRTVTSFRWRLVVVGALFFLALSTYEISICLPALVLPLMWWRFLPGRARIGAFAGMFTLVFALNLLARHLATGQVVSAYGSEFFAHGAMTYAANIPKAFGRLFLPPCADAHQQIFRFTLLILVLSLLAFRIFRSTTGDDRRSILSFGWFLLVALWLAIIGGVSTQTSESDRFLYLPSVFLAAAVACALATLTSTLLRWAVFAGLIICSWSALRENHANWIVASRIAEGVLQDMRGLADGSPLLVRGLPDEFEGAFIFRHGFDDALLLNGIDTTGIRTVDPLMRAEMIERGMGEPIFSAGVDERIGHLTHQAGFGPPTAAIAIREVRWEVDRFPEVPL